ncbi:MAG: hypothetical protein JWP38_3698 [Herbaspirillum sp.]|nr:hypothetical protein [Herbaspirillum sp.]
MRSPRSGGAAFPLVFRNGQAQSGMTLRDYFAIHADSHDVACATEELSLSGGLNHCVSAAHRLATARYAVADAMLAECAK